MIAVLLLGLLAFASAAPRYYHHHREPLSHFPQPGNHHGSLSDNFGDGVFDTGSFWMGLANEMHRLDEMLNDFTKHFPISKSSEGIEGNDYVITITLSGFDEKDIVVKAREGVLMIQAVHETEEGSQRNYLDLRTLPSYVNVAGNWTYDKGVLKIVFPVTKKPEETTEAVVTQKPVEDEDKSREEMDNNENTITQDADVGLNRGDTDKETELMTNVIPTRDEKNTVEATTYAVDLKNEVEFVPVKY